MTDRRPDAALLAGLALAYALFARTFRGPKAGFWNRMTLTGLLLGSVALAADPALRRTKPRLRDAAAGAAMAAALYGIFQTGDRMARRIMPRGGPEIDEVYALRTLSSPGAIAARLALVIAPAEELFWRGFVQDRLARRFGRLGGAALAAAAYGGAHVVTRNATLTGAATVAGTFWSAMAAAGMPMAALVASHVAWDILILLVAPTGTAGPTPS